MKTATNPETGEKIVLIDGEWKPYSKSATNDKGQKAFLVGDAWVQATSTPTPKETPKAVESAPVKKEKGFFDLPDIITNPTPETIAADPLVRFAIGAAELPLGVAQLGLNIVGKGDWINDNRKTLAALKKSGMEKNGSGETDLTGMAGSLFGPGGALKVAKYIPGATGLLGKLGVGAATGAALGAGATVNSGDNYWDEKLGQVVSGAAVGALLPGGVELAKGAKKVATQLLQPLTESGRATILREYVNGLTGPAKDKVITALREAKELVPGSKPTAGQAIADIPEATGLAAYQDTLSKTTGKLGKESPISAQFNLRAAQQEGAREEAVSSIAKDKGILSAAKEARKVAAAENYGKAYEQAIKADPMLAQMSNNPYFKDAVPFAMKEAAAKGIDGKKDLTQFLHYVKLGLDKEIQKTGDNALSNTQRETVQTLQKDLVKWMGSKNELYEKARDEFSKASVPINQMQVGQYLKDKLISATGNERAASFAEAVRNAPGTIKRSSGQSRFDDLGQVLNKDQKALIDGISADLKRDVQFGNLAKATSLDDATKLAEGEIKSPKMLNTVATVTNWGLKLLKNGADDKIQKMAADLMLNPKKLATFMEGVPASQKKNVAEMMLQRIPPAMRADMELALTRVVPVLSVTRDD